MQPVPVTDRRFGQFDLWFGNPREGSAGILIAPDTCSGDSGRSGKVRLDQCAPPDVLVVERRGVPLRRFRCYLCEGYRR